MQLPKRLVLCLCAVPLLMPCAKAQQQTVPSTASEPGAPPQAAAPAPEPAAQTQAAAANEAPAPNETAAKATAALGETTVGAVRIEDSAAAPPKLIADAHGKKKKKKEKLPKMTHLDILSGTLTVDGWTGKAELNYEIADLKYLYFYAPGVGTAIVSDLQFPGAKEQKDAFDDKTLTFAVDGHAFQLTSDKRLLGKKPVSAFVKLDPHYQADARFPVMGYGTATVAPYMWPGAKAQAAKNAALAAPPPLPAEFRPKLATAACIPTAAKPCAATAVPLAKPTLASQGSSPPSASSAAAADAPVPAESGSAAGPESSPPSPPK